MSNWLRVPENVQAVLGTIDTLMRQREADAPPRGYTIYHPSALGGCLRQMQYACYQDMGFIKTVGEEFDSRLLRLFEKGHNMQSRWERYFDELGVLRGVWHCINPICRHFDDDGKHVGEPKKGEKTYPRVYGKDNLIGCFNPKKCVCGSDKFSYHEVLVESKELNIRGHADIILDFSQFDAERFTVLKAFDIEHLPKKPIVVDMKTINDNGFKRKVMKYGPSLKYQIQLMVYANILDCEYGMLIYESKNDSTVKAFHISKNEDTWFELIKTQTKLMSQMIIGKKLPPPRSFTKSDSECMYCPHAKRCHASKVWDDDKALKESRIDFYGELLETH